MEKSSSRSQKPDICPEAQFLLDCARACIDFENADLERSLPKGDFSWVSFLRLAFKHRMIPLLQVVLSGTMQEFVPPIALKMMHDHTCFSIQRNQTLIRELMGILALFESHEILAVPHKGPVLSESLYQNPALRDSGDLDLLIRKRDVRHAMDLLVDRGYTLPRSDASETTREFIFQFKHSYNLIRQSDLICLDLHWKFTDKHIPFDLSLGDMRDCLTPVAFAGRTVLSPSPEIMLNLLCVHGSKHFNPWERLLWICDLARLFKVYNCIDWGQTIEFAEKYGIKRVLAVGVLLAGQLLKAEIPRGLSKRLRHDSVAEALSRQIGGRFFQEEGRATRYDEKAVPNLIFRIRMRERLRDRKSTLVLLALRKLSMNRESRSSLKTLPFRCFLPLTICALFPTRVQRF